MPSTTTIKIGDTVLWTQQDSPGEIHTVTSGRFENSNAGNPLDPLLDSPFLFEGDTCSHSFDQPVTYLFYCQIHPDVMNNGVIIAE